MVPCPLAKVVQPSSITTGSAADGSDIDPVWAGCLSDAILRAFDLLELNGVDYRGLPLSRRKDRLARLLARVHVESRSTSTPMLGANWCSGRRARKPGTSFRHTPPNICGLLPVPS
jgi:hypothetical protein